MALAVDGKNIAKHRDESIEQLPRSYKWDIDWKNCILLLLIHVGAVYGLYIRTTHSYSHSLTIIGKGLGYLSGVGVTAGAHRLWCHKTYKAKLGLELFLMFCMTTTYQNSIFTWCRDHRLHHKYTETDADPHNAKRGFFFSHMGWLMVRKQPEVIQKGREIDMTDLLANRLVMFQHKYYPYLVFMLTFLLPSLIPWYFYNENYFRSLCGISMYRYVISVHLTWCVNSVSHLYGNKPYDKNIGAVENNVMMYLTFGEGFHNYHHTFPWDYKTSEYGGSGRNATACIIDLFAWMGLAYDLRTVPQSVIDQKIKRTGDGSKDNGAWNFLYKLVPKQFLDMITSWIVLYFVITIF